MEFTHYYGKHKQKNGAILQADVVHSRKLQFRLSGQELKKFNEHKYYSSQRYNESEFIKTLIKEALDKRDADSWTEEVKNL